jgi:hypothetical protein
VNDFFAQEGNVAIVKEVKADFRGHQIAVRNSVGWSFPGIWPSADNRLYIDGKQVDTNADAIILSTKVPVMRGSIVEGGKTHVVEVYMNQRDLRRFYAKIRIDVDGAKVGGDDF